MVPGRPLLVMQAEGYLANAPQYVDDVLGPFLFGTGRAPVPRRLALLALAAPHAWRWRFAPAALSASGLAPLASHISIFIGFPPFSHPRFLTRGSQRAGFVPEGAAAAAGGVQGGREQGTGDLELCREALHVLQIGGHALQWEER